ncbi:subtilisin-like protein [Aureobasidium pullulans]|uniref:tripeptidyl-peptidase II n=1 Tax=Aureobasidium pullulans TaxID=5580 RepID=A0AB74JK09_AURPU|nr:subtilisin-like protein [Aureobasidium pullulans]THX49504.1 subtilisin-like protein [Aureobasidium pullulans]TIA11070.1 subtilisin-like protein [Aureobasidium pullulans]
MQNILLIAALLGARHVHSFAIPTNGEDSGFVKHEEISVLPEDWSLSHQASADSILHLRVALSHAHKNYIDIAEQVSDPLSAQYGLYLSAQELQASLPDTTILSEAVTAWLCEHNISDATVAHDWIDFSTTVGQANSLLKANFSTYTHKNSDPVLRTQQYSLPIDMSNHIDFIYPTVHFFAPKKNADHAPQLQARQHFPTGPVTCSDGTSTCPPLLKSKYNINYVPKDNTSGSQIAIAGFLERYPNITDWKSFLSKYGLAKSNPAPSFTPISINNGVKSFTGGDLAVEPNLDLDYASVFTGKLPITYYSVGGRPAELSQPGNKPVPTAKLGNEPYLEFLQYVLQQKSPPQVISISYSDDEQTVPLAYARKVCDLLAQAAARGISVIGSSGDGGAAGTGTTSTCVGPDGKHRFVPTFPSSCPWITTVGATASYGGTASYSSGGISNYFARPSWQTNVVAGYIKALNGSHAGLYNKTGRGVPDVSLLGDNYLTLESGFASRSSGTSASAPVFAAMVALINDIRLRAKRPVLGFLNPLLYSDKAKTVFRDVADGSQGRGCSDGSWFEPGWEVLAGWDAATGLGEPDFDKLRALLS